MKTKFNFWKWLLGIATAAAILFTASAENVLFFWKDGEVANLGNYQRFIPIDDVDSITVGDNNTMFISPSRIEVGLFQEYFDCLIITTAEGKEIDCCDYSWRSLDTTVLRFEGVTRIYPVAPGECNIIASSYDGMTGKAHVVVKDEDIYFIDDDKHRMDTISMSLFTYDSEDFQNLITSVSRNSIANEAEYINSDTTVVHISKNYCMGTLYIGVESVGECDITATYKGKSAKLHVIVEDEDIYFSPDTLRMKINWGEKVPNMLYCTNMGNLNNIGWNYDIDWDDDFASTNSKVAKNYDYAIEAVSPGECDFILTYRGKEAKLHVIVEEPKVYFNKDTVRLSEFDSEYHALWLYTEELINSVDPDYAYTTDSSVAVSYKGCYITPVGAGECDFVAVYNGKEAKCHVVVEEERVVFSKSRSLKDTLSTLTMNANDDYPTIYAIGSKGHILSSVKFGSTNSKVAMADNGKSSDDFILIPQGEGECSIIASTNKGKTARLAVKIVSNNIGGHEYVDLGLPSGTLWATMNVGAKSPEDYGDYFAWGETKTKSSYPKEECDFCGADYKDLQIDYIIDKNGNLTPSYDAATMNWGKDWRMPIRAEIEELLTLDNEYAVVSGVKGRKFYGNNGNTLFFPFAGYRLAGGLYLRGERGYYWSATADEGDLNACRIGVSSDWARWNSYKRYDGQPVRPVLRK